MKTPTLILSLASGILFAGCATNKPEAVIIPVSTESTMTIETPGAPMRTPEKLGIYHIGRVQDPTDPNIMHLQGQVIRVERPSRWVKAGAGEGTRTLISQETEEPIQHYTQQPTAADLELKANMMQEVMRRLEEKNKELVGKLESFSKAAEITTEMKLETEKLKTEVQSLRKELDSRKAAETPAEKKKSSWKFW